MINLKSAFSSIGEFVGGLVELLASLAALGIVSEVIFGQGVWGMNVVGNLVAIITTFGDNGFAGLLALLVLVGLWNKK
tara:strand:- start:294 stop:527 length:234 start_codon:yes stop_codon:yes gene_type:complete